MSFLSYWISVVLINSQPMCVYMGSSYLFSPMTPLLSQPVQLLTLREQACHCHRTNRSRRMVVVPHWVNYFLFPLWTGGQVWGATAPLPVAPRGNTEDVLVHALKHTQRFIKMSQAQFSCLTADRVFRDGLQGHEKDSGKRTGHHRENNKHGFYHHTATMFI